MALGRVDAAIAAYGAAIAREAKVPHIKTQAGNELTYAIALCGVRAHYGRVIELLDRLEDGLRFPVNEFRSHAARTLDRCGRGCS